MRDTTRDIDRRLRSLKEEVAKLEAARSALLGGRGTSRRAGRPSARVPPARDTRRGGARERRTRAGQALDLVKRNPGITIPQIAESLRIEPNYLYRVMPKLVAEQEVRREGQGWYPNGDALADITAPHPSASIPYSDEEYDSLVRRLERSAAPNERLRRTMSGRRAPRG